MKQLRGSSLEFSFYFADLPEPEPFNRVVRALVELGARFGGEDLVAQGKGINGQPFADTFEPEPDILEISDEATFLEILTNPDRRIIELIMPGAIYATQDLAERVTYLSIPQKAAFSSNHSIAIWSLWDTFSGIPEDSFGPKSKANSYRQIARKKGREVYHRFADLVNKLRPTYAAIALEGESFLPCPYELRSDTRSFFFKNFYLGSDYFTPEDFAMVRNLYEDAYSEMLPGGLYVSGYEFFNPPGKTLDFNKVGEFSAETGKLIGQRVR